MDAEPLALVGRVLGAPPRLERNVPPQCNLVQRVSRWMLEPPGQGSPHDELPAPGLMTISVDELLDLTLRNFQLGRRRTVCGRLARRCAGIGTQLSCADQRRNEGAHARRYECQLVPQLDDPPRDDVAS